MTADSRVQSKWNDPEYVPAAPTNVNVPSACNVAKTGGSSKVIELQAVAQQEDEYHPGLRVSTGANRLMTIRTSVAVPLSNGLLVPRLRWFTLIDFDDELRQRFCGVCGQAQRHIGRESDDSRQYGVLTNSVSVGASAC